MQLKECRLIFLRFNDFFIYGNFFLANETIHRADIRLSDIANRLHGDWTVLAKELGVNDSSIAEIENECPNNIPQQAMLMLRLWLHMNSNKACGK